MRVKNLTGIVMRIAAILLCLVLFSSHLASGMFARYTVSATENGTANVAKYGVTVVPVNEGAGDPLTNDVSGNVSYQFKVDNSHSQVAVKYDIYISFSDCYEGDTKIADVEGTFRNVRLNGYGPNRILNDDRNVIYVFEVMRMLRPGSVSSPFTLTFNIYPSWTDTTVDTLPADLIALNVDGHDYRYRYPVNVFVEAEQID